MVKFATLSTALVSIATFAQASASSGSEQNAIEPKHLSLLDADILGDVNLLNPGIDIDLDAGVGILASSTCGALGTVLSVGVGIDIDIPPLLHLDICICVNVLQLVPESNFQVCPPCGQLKETICGAGQCGCQCVDNAHPLGDVCACDAGYLPVDGECVLAPSGRARRAKRQHVAELATF